MGATLRMIFLCAFFVAIISLQVNLEAKSTASRYLKNSLEIATHDGGLGVYEDKLANGIIDFNEVQSEGYILDSLRYHLNMTQGTTRYQLMPTDDSFFQEPIEIKFIDFLDDSLYTFPTSYTNVAYGIDIPILDPSIVVLIEGKAPTLLGSTSNTMVSRLVIYEYKK